MGDVNYIYRHGDLMKVAYNDGSVDLAYPASNDLYYVNASSSSPASIIDNILPGHSFTNPGGTIASSWQWHIDNTTTDGGVSGRGGNDLNYSYGTDFFAPAAGVASTWDLSGVGMITRLILDVPVNRTNPTLYTSEAAGPMTAIWFEHGYYSVTGHVNQGDLLGKSGDGYGGYGAHLHVHGLVDNGSVAGTANRCCFWSFI